MGGGVDAEKLAQYKAEHPEMYYTPPPGKCNSLIHAPIHAKYYLRRTWGGLGWRFMWHVTAAYFGFKGIMFNLIQQLQTPYFLSFMKVSSVPYGNYVQIISAPYSMKAFYGVISDLFPIGGWRKRWYLVAAIVLSVISFVVLTFAPLGESAAIPAVLLFTSCYAAGAIVDLFTEARYAEVMGENPYIGSDIVSWNWGLYQVAQLLMSASVGLMAHQYKETNDTIWLKSAMAIGIPFSLQMLLPVWLNWMGENRIPAGERGFQTKVWREQKDTIILGLIMGGCVVVNVIFTLFSDDMASALNLGDNMGQLPLLVESVLISLVATAAVYKFLPLMVAHAMTYMFLSSAFFFYYAGLQSYFTVGPDCLPDGPHFSYSFYITINGVTGALFGAIGVTLFQAVMGDWSFRPCFWVTTLLMTTAGLCDIAFVTGFWHNTLHIPNHVSYFFGQNMLAQIVQMMNLMPGVALTSKLCPKGVEGTMYALLAGFSNFGQNIAGNMGSFMFDVAGIKIGEDLAGECNTDNLWWVLLIGECLTPLITIPLTFVMIPEGKMRGVLIDKDGNQWPPAEDESDSEAPSATKDLKDIDNGVAANPEYELYSVPMPAPSPEDAARQYGAEAFNPPQAEVNYWQPQV